MNQPVIVETEDDDSGGIEEKLVVQCAPLIEGLKVSNLLILPSGEEDQLYSILLHTDLSYIQLFYTRDKTTYLVFREDLLDQYLNQMDVREFLSGRGYPACLDLILDIFRDRYERYMAGFGAFPHEMGLLLGYPVEDVRGFMNNDGKNFLYAGYWKVYGNVPEKKWLFQRYEGAKRKLEQMLASGISLSMIIRKEGQN